MWYIEGALSRHLVLLLLEDALSWSPFIPNFYLCAASKVNQISAIVSSSEMLERGFNHDGSDPDSVDKAQVQQVDNVDTNTSARSTQALEAPEFIRNWTPEERKRNELHLVRRIDLRLMPMIILMYILNYLDRNNIAAAKLAGIMEDLNLKPVEFQASLREKAI